VSNPIKPDQAVVNEGRREALKDVQVPLRDQVIDKLVAKLEEMEVGMKLTDVWNSANADRQDYLSRQQNLLSEFDEFLEPIYEPTQEWSSTLHLPVAFTIAKTYHARMFAALFAVDPSFTVKARQAANADRAPLIQELMRYTLSTWMNYYQGFEDVADAWLWKWITTGSGFLKQKWDRVYTRYVDVVEEMVPGADQLAVDPATGKQVLVPGAPIKKEVERKVTKLVFEGPCTEVVDYEDVIIVGGGGDPQLADYTFHSSYMTASDLWQLADQGVFRDDIVADIIKSGENRKSGEAANQVKNDKAMAAGTAGVDKEFDLERYHVIECNAKIDVDGSGITADVIVWFHKETSKILRATYLYRVMPQGMRNIFRIDFHKRHGQDYSVGLIELVYSLTKELDAIHNMKVDFGLLSTMPMGFYRPTSSLSDGKLPYEPGSLLPLDNPQSDVFFPQMGNRAVFGQQEEAQIYNYIERMTSISDMSLGIIGGQGAARTATGARALLGESNANLDIYLRRMNRGFRQFLLYTFFQLQQKIQPGFQFRLLGDDGNNYWGMIKSREELAGMYDFELEPNSANSNKQIQLEQAQQIYQMSSNPLDIQLGIITPLQRYEAMKLMLQSYGVKDYGRFLQKPQGQMRIYTPEEVANRVLAGVNVQLGPEQDLEGIAAYISHIFDEDELLGQFNEEQAIALAKKMQEAQAMQAAVQASAADAANARQVQVNSGLSQAPANMQMGTQAGPQVPPQAGES
jgi:hypothetical protein